MLSNYFGLKESRNSVVRVLDFAKATHTQMLESINFSKVNSDNFQKKKAIVDRAYPSGVLNAYYAIGSMLLDKNPVSMHSDDFPPDFLDEYLLAEAEYFEHPECVYSEMLHVLLCRNDLEWEPRGKYMWCRCDSCTKFHYNTTFDDFVTHDSEDTTQDVIAQIVVEQVENDFFPVLAPHGQVMCNQNEFDYTTSGMIEATDLHGRTEVILIGGKKKKRKGSKRGKYRGTRNNAPRKRNGPSVHVPRTLGPISPNTTVTMEYTETILTGSMASGSVFPYVFRANSIFDPNRTGGGHQPYAFDIYAGIYNRYLVLRTRARVVFCSSGDIYECAILFSNGTFTLASLADFNLMREMPYSRFGSLGYAGTPNQVLSKGVGLARLTGAPKTKYESDDSYAGTFATNATEVLDFNVGIYNASTVAVTTAFTITLWYDVMLWDPLPLAISFRDKTDALCAKADDIESYFRDKAAKEKKENRVRLPQELTALNVRVVL